MCSRRKLALALVLLASLLLPVQGWAANAFVQGKETTACCSQASHSITTTSSVTAGNLLALYIFVDTTTGITISSVDGSSCQSNTFTFAGDNPTSGGNQGQAWGYYAKNISGGTCTITVTMSANVVLFTLYLHEISGADLATPLAQHVGNFQTTPGTGTDAVTTTSVTTTTNGEYIFAAASTIGTSNMTAGTGFTSVVPESTRISEYQIQSSAGSIAGTFTQASEGTFVTSILMTFKVAQAGGSKLLLLGVAP